jgi:hypothetical protein
MTGQTFAATRPRRTGIDLLKRRWPTALALVLSAITLDGSGSGGSVFGLAEALLLLPLGYLTVTKLKRPRASWPVLVCGIATLILLRLLDVIAPAAVLVAIASIVLVWAAVDGQLQRSALFQVQALGMLGFGATGTGRASRGPAIGPLCSGRRMVPSRPLGLPPSPDEEGRCALLRGVVRRNRHPDRRATARSPVAMPLERALQRGRLGAAGHVSAFSRAWCLAG